MQDGDRVLGSIPDRVTGPRSVLSVFLSSLPLSCFKHVSLGFYYLEPKQLN